MKKPLILPILLFNRMFSSTSYAEWKLIDAKVDGSIAYFVELDTIKVFHEDNTVYFFSLGNYAKPDDFGFLSYKTFHQANCRN